MQNHSDGSEGGGLLKFLGGFLKTVMHGALKVMLGKCDNAEVNKRADFLRMRLLQLPNDKTRLGFQLPQDVYNHFQYCFSEVAVERCECLQFQKPLFHVVGQLINLNQKQRQVFLRLCYSS